MIGTISIKCNAAHPEMALPTVFAYVSSPSSIRIIDVPKKIGKWKINEVSLTFAYPDGSIVSAPCVLTGGVWVATVDGTSTSGTSKNGFTIFANGTDENGDNVNGYILGKGDLNVLDADGGLHPEELKWYVRLVDEEPEEPKTGDLFRDVDYYIYDSNGQKRALGVTHPELTNVNNKANMAVAQSDEAKQIATQAVAKSDGARQIAIQAGATASSAESVASQAAADATTAMTAAQQASTNASTAISRSNNAYNTALAAQNIANAALPKTDVVAPLSSATQGQAADALATSNALDGKVDKSGLRVDNMGMYFTNQGYGTFDFNNGNRSAFKPSGISFRAANYAAYEYGYPLNSGTLALVEQIYDAVKNLAQAWSSEVEWPAWKTCSYNGVIYENTSGSTIPIGTTTTPDTPNSGWTKKRVDELFLSRMGGRLFGTLDVWNGDITTENNIVGYGQSRLELYNDSSRTGDYTYYGYSYIETGHNPTGPDDTENWYETFSFPRIHAEGDTLVSEITLSNHLSSKVDGDGVLKIQSITQAAYDALATKDATTLYVING